MYLKNTIAKVLLIFFEMHWQEYFDGVNKEYYDSDCLICLNLYLQYSVLGCPVRR